MNQTDTTDKLAKLLRDTRKSEKLTLQDISDRSGVALRQISLIERSKHSPRVSTVVKIVKALGKELDITIN